MSLLIITSNTCSLNKWACLQRFSRRRLLDMMTDTTKVSIDAHNGCRTRVRLYHPLRLRLPCPTKYAFLKNSGEQTQAWLDDSVGTLIKYFFLPLRSFGNNQIVCNDRRIRRLNAHQRPYNDLFVVAGEPVVFAVTPSVKPLKTRFSYFNKPM